VCSSAGVTSQCNRSSVGVSRRRMKCSSVSELFACVMTTASVVKTGGHRLCGLVCRDC
jgi:hypothetical protein